MEKVRLEAAQEQLLSVLASCRNPKEIAISCIGKLLRGEFSGEMTEDHLGDFVESIALHEGLEPAIAYIRIALTCEGCASHSSSEPLELFVFLPTVRIGDRPHHTDDASRCSTNATLLHDWYCEAIRRASPQYNEPVTAHDLKEFVF